MNLLQHLISTGDFQTFVELQSMQKMIQKQHPNLRIEINCIFEQKIKKQNPASQKNLGGKIPDQNIEHEIILLNRAVQKRLDRDTINQIIEELANEDESIRDIIFRIACKLKRNVRDWRTILHILGPEEDSPYQLTITKEDKIILAQFLLRPPGSTEF